MPGFATDSQTINVRPLTDQELERHIAELPEKPLFLGVDGLRLSLAGVQEKAAVCVQADEICLPLLGTPTTHILKPANEKFPSLVPNEYLCLVTAKDLGLEVPSVQMKFAGAHDYLLVERYDRKSDGERITRIHQEDFCQALSNRQKYQRFSGPSHKECFDLLLRSTVPILDRNALMDALIYNFLIGNGDAHGKNFSLLYPEPQGMRLAPFYDLVCTQIYDDLSPEMSMKIGKTYRFRSVGADDWILLAKQVGFSYPAIRSKLRTFASSLPTSLIKQRESIKGSRYDGPGLDRMVDFVSKNCERTLSIISGDVRPNRTICTSREPLSF